ncbi:HIT family protein [Patescibacteria group bacterium]|nr:HIT family protein [Patescibacteria group bacterium]
MQKDYYTSDTQKNARTGDMYEQVKSNLRKCPFCDLKDKYIIYERNETVLTVNLFPYIDSHLLIIPRKHHLKFADINSKEWNSVKYLISLGIEILNKGMNIKNTNILYREGIKAGVSLEHLHFHIIPVTPEFIQYKKDHFLWTFQKINYSPIEIAKKLKKIATKYAK